MNSCRSLRSKRLISKAWRGAMWCVLMWIINVFGPPPVQAADGTRKTDSITVSDVVVSPVLLRQDGSTSQPGSIVASVEVQLSGRYVRTPTLSASIVCTAQDDAAGEVWSSQAAIDSSCLPQGDTRTCTVPIEGTWNGALPSSLAATATSSELFTCSLNVSLSQPLLKDSSEPFWWLREEAQTIEVISFDETQTVQTVETTVSSWSDEGEQLPVMLQVEQGETQTIGDLSIEGDDIILSIASASEINVGSPMLLPKSPILTLGPDHSEFTAGVVVCLTPETESQGNPTLELYSYFPEENRWISCTEQGIGRCENERPEGASDEMVCARVFHFSDWMLGDESNFHMSFTLDTNVALASQEAGLLTGTVQAIPWKCTPGSSCPSSLPVDALVFSKEVSSESTPWTALLQLRHCNGSGVCTNVIGNEVDVTFTSKGVSNANWTLGIIGNGTASTDGKLPLEIDSTQRAAWYSIKASISLKDVYAAMGISLPDITLTSEGTGINCPGSEGEDTSPILTECLNIVAVPDVDKIERATDGVVTVKASNWTGNNKNLDTGEGTASIGWVSELECYKANIMGMSPTGTSILADALSNPSGSQTGTLAAPTHPYARVGVTFNGLTAWGYCIPVSGYDIPAPGDLDSDGDEFTENGEPRDCDDFDPYVNPNAVEVCDGKDNNCDDQIDEDRDDFDRDSECDAIDSDDDNDGAEDTADCGPLNSSIYPGADEICDSVDNDCDGSIDDADDLVTGQPNWYVDGDGDEHGSTTIAGAACTAPDGSVSSSDDCNDANAAINPSASEVCDGDDNDCDGLIDDADTGVADQKSWYRDQDSDTYPLQFAEKIACSQPLGYIARRSDEQWDCDDDPTSGAAINPAATEICDSVDNDCDDFIDDADESVTGRPTWYPDQDTDTYPLQSEVIAACTQPLGYIAQRSDAEWDCDDNPTSGAAINPAATEICDSVDNDCDDFIDDADESVTGQTTWFRDQDSDTYPLQSDEKVACSQPLGHIAQRSDEQWDCDDDPTSGGAIFPAATEICDSVDNDCDGSIDDSDESVTGQTTWYGDQDSDTYPLQSDKKIACTQPLGYIAQRSDAQWDCDDSPTSGGAINPAATEICDSVDNDCDDFIDDADESVTGQPTWYRDQDSDTYPLRSDVATACTQPLGYIAQRSDAEWDCDDNPTSGAAINPAATELCDSVDNDCDGLIDDADTPVTGQKSWYRDQDSDTYPLQSDKKVACSQPSGYIAQRSDEQWDCDDSPTSGAAINPAATEICDSADNDCDDLIDDADESITGQPTWYRDQDTDTYPLQSDVVTACTQPEGYIAQRSDAQWDCDDNPTSGAAINPAATEICDSVDNDCDGSIDDADDPVTGQTTWYDDQDGDGFGDAGTATVSCMQPPKTVPNAADCDDAHSSIHPGAEESCNDRDDNCDGLTDVCGGLAVTLNPYNATPLDTLECAFSLSTSDAQSGVSAKFGWIINGQSIEGLEERFLTNPTDEDPIFEIGDQISCVVQVSDLLTDAWAEGKSEPITIIDPNHPPTIDSVTLSPESAFEESTLECQTEASDPDEDELTYDVVWYVNDTPLFELAVMVPDEAIEALDGTSFDKGDEVYCGVTVSDGMETTKEIQSNAVIIQNTPPTSPTVSLTPTTAFEGSTLTCSASGSTDVDPVDTVTYKYAWQRYKAIVSGQTGNTLTGTYFNKGDSVTCSAAGYDGTAESAYVTSNAAIIQNTPPTSPTRVTLTPTTAYEGSTLTCSASGSTDVDPGDTVTYKYAWQVYGVTVSGHTGNTLTGTYFNKGDSVTCSAAGYDGTATSTSVTSNAVIIGSTDPTPPTVSLAPTTAYEGSTLTCSASGSTDVDPVDTVTYKYAWKVYSATVIGQTGNTLTGTYFNKGDSVTCSAAGHDGTATSAYVTSNAVIIQNTAPISPTTVALTPTTAYEGSTLTCSASGSTDVDPVDTVTYKYAWKVNGGTVIGQTGNTLSGTYFNKPDSVTCSAAGYDGTATSAYVTSNAVIIQNTAPISPTAVALTPTTAYEGSTLTCSASGSTDVDPVDTVTNKYAWQVKGVTVSGQTGNTLTGTYFNKGDSVTCSAAGYDGTATSAYVASNAVIIQNTPPTSPKTVSLAPTTAYEGSTLTCSASGSMDVDPVDIVTNKYSWQVNGVTVSGQTGNTLTGTYFNKGDSVTCSAAGYDGTATSAYVTSNAVIIQNTAPAVTCPTAASVGEDSAANIGCSASDADGDSVTTTCSASPSYATCSVSGTGSSRTVKVTPSSNYSGNLSITVLAKDTSNASSSAVIQLTVVEVNDSPYFYQGIPAATTDEDKQVIVDTYGYDEEDDTWVAGSCTAADKSLVPDANCICGNRSTVYHETACWITPGTNKYGSTTITVKIVDDDGASRTTTFTLTVFSDADEDGYTTQSGDCNDSSASAYPGAKEVCDGIDNDCDGSTDEGVLITFYRDTDGDGYGSATSGTTTACSKPGGYSSSSTDCNDSNASVYPGATEQCDGLDNDCDGTKDEGVTGTWYRDADNDTYGTSTTTSPACPMPSGYVARAGDCDDTKATVYPYATELCDSLDNDCDGSKDEDATKTWYEDYDCDGYGDSAYPFVYGCQPPSADYNEECIPSWCDPRSSEPCSCQTVYYHCSVEVVGDCNDGASGVYPGAYESCDGYDNDCDGKVDENACILPTVPGETSSFFLDDTLQSPDSQNSSVKDIRLDGGISVRPSERYGFGTLIELACPDCALIHPSIFDAVTIAELANRYVAEIQQLSGDYFADPVFERYAETGLLRLPSPEEFSEQAWIVLESLDGLPMTVNPSTLQLEWFIVSEDGDLKQLEFGQALLVSERSFCTSEWRWSLENTDDLSAPIEQRALLVGGSSGELCDPTSSQLPGGAGDQGPVGILLVRSH